MDLQRCLYNDKDWRLALKLTLVDIIHAHTYGNLVSNSNIYKNCYALHQKQEREEERQSWWEEDKEVEGKKENVANSDFIFFT